MRRLQMVLLLGGCSRLEEVTARLAAGRIAGLLGRGQAVFRVESWALVPRFVFVGGATCARRARIGRVAVGGSGKLRIEQRGGSREMIQVRREESGKPRV
jgi:hypothetical protein